MNSLDLRQLVSDKKEKYLLSKIMSDVYMWKTLCDYPFVGSYSEIEKIIDEFLEKIQAFFLGKVIDGKKDSSPK